MPLLLKVLIQLIVTTLFFGENIGLNKRIVPINRTGSSNWHQRVGYEFHVYWTLQLVGGKGLQSSGQQQLKSIMWDLNNQSRLGDS